MLEAARGPVEVIVTESQASLADDQLKKKRGIRRARARACLLRSFGFLPGEPGDSAQSPQNLIAGPGTRAGRAEELEEPEEQEELWWRPPAPAPPRFHILRRKCQRGVVQSEEVDDYFRSRLKLERRGRRASAHLSAGREAPSLRLHPAFCRHWSPQHPLPLSSLIPHRNPSDVILACGRGLLTQTAGPPESPICKGPDPGRGLLTAKPWAHVRGAGGRAAEDTVPTAQGPAKPHAVSPDPWKARLPFCSPRNESSVKTRPWSSRQPLKTQLS